MQQMLHFAILTGEICPYATLVPDTFFQRQDGSEPSRALVGCGRGDCLSPLDWERVNLNGDYAKSAKTSRKALKFKALRNP